MDTIEKILKDGVAWAVCPKCNHAIETWGHIKFMYEAREELSDPFWNDFIECQKCGEQCSTPLEWNKTGVRQLTIEESMWYVCPRCGSDRWMVDKGSLSSRDNPTLLGCAKCGFIKVA